MRKHVNATTAPAPSFFIFLPSFLPSFLSLSSSILLLDFPHVVAVLVAVVVFACDSLQFVGVVLGIFRNDDFPKRYLPKRFVAANAFFGATRNPLRVGLYVCTYVSMYVCMYECMNVCVYECMYVCMNVCMYVCT